MSFVDGDVFPISVECMDDAQRLHAKDDAIRYTLVVSAETAERTSNTIHNEVRDRTGLRASARGRIRP